MDTKTMASFIMGNCDLVDTYDLREAYIRTIRQRIKKEFGVYVRDEFISSDLTYSQNWARYWDKEIAPRFTSLEEYKFYQKVQNFGSHIYSIEGDTIQASGLAVNYLVYLMYYIVFDELDDNLKRANNIQEESGFNHDTPNFKFTNFNKFGSVEVKKCNNGRITFKGLLDEQRARLHKIYEITHRR
jgi:hypothetical protein